MPTLRAKRIAGLVGAGLAVAAATGAWLVLATPAFYARTEPIGADHPAKDLFNERVVNGVANVLLDKSGRTPLDLAITEEMVNARLAKLLEETRARGESLPPVLEALRIGFEPGRLIVATRVGVGAGSLVLSQHLIVAPTPDGRLRVETAGVQAGYLPLPSRLANHLVRALEEHVDRLEAERPDDPTLALWRGVLEALEGKPVALAGKKLGIALDAVQIDRGVLRARGHRIER
ncbi:MAG TPA: hypothetical protein VMW52_04275 [Phycisphaerae bacterium]|nr:hypothetical protein [Phycisphaerae bacterium]